MSSAGSVTIVDYGIGNLYSVQRAFESVGARVEFASDPDHVLGARRLVLPGVGAFADGMDGLRARGLVEPLLAYAASRRPLLGICLGMQMLGSHSEEFGRHPGLGIVPGAVRALPATSTAGTPHKIPNIGWRELQAPAGRDWTGSALAATAPGAAVYLVHSYHLQPDDPADLLAVTYYGGHTVTAAVARGAVIGCQFHPERSGRVGLGILARFLSS